MNMPGETDPRGFTPDRIYGGAVKCPDGCWQCFFCRTIHAGKFCEECGRPRPVPDER